MLDYLRNEVKQAPFSIKPKGRIIVERNQTNNSDPAKKLGPKDDGYVLRRSGNNSGSFKGSLVSLK